MAMVDMKRSKKEQKAGMAMPEKVTEDYPYGLRVSLDHESLQKLGLHKLPKVGDKLHLHAHAHVTEVSEEHRDGGQKHRRVALELRKMHIANKAEADEAELNKEAKSEMDKALNRHKGGKAGYDASEEDDGPVTSSER